MCYGHGANPNQGLNEKGETIIHKLAYNFNEKIWKFLHPLKANLNAMDINGVTPIVNF